MTTWLGSAFVKKPVRLLRDLWKENSGRDLTEYALIVALVALLSLTAMSAFGVRLSDLFSTAGAAVSNRSTDVTITK
jgi:Flp pilus assembly pilin Flp